MYFQDDHFARARTPGASALNSLDVNAVTSHPRLLRNCTAGCSSPPIVNLVLGRSVGVTSVGRRCFDHAMYSWWVGDIRRYVVNQNRHFDPYFDPYKEAACCAASTGASQTSSFCTFLPGHAMMSIDKTTAESPLHFVACRSIIWEKLREQ